MVESIIKPLRPKTSGWRALPSPPSWVTLGYAGETWVHLATRIYVISAVEVAVDDDGVERGPEYHVSISRNGGRCSTQAARDVLRQFGADGAEEDNHVPSGIVRNFWLPVAEALIGQECACKADEPAVREDRGDYIWRAAPRR